MRYLTELIDNCCGKFELVVNPHKDLGMTVDEYMLSVEGTISDTALCNPGIAQIMIDTDTIIYIKFCVDSDSFTALYGHEIEAMCKAAIQYLEQEQPDNNTPEKTVHITIDERSDKETLH